MVQVVVRHRRCFAAAVVAAIAADAREAVAANAEGAQEPVRVLSSVCHVA